MDHPGAPVSADFSFSGGLAGRVGRDRGRRSRGSCGSIANLTLTSGSSPRRPAWPRCRSGIDGHRHVERGRDRRHRFAEDDPRAPRPRRRRLDHPDAGRRSGRGLSIAPTIDMDPTGWAVVRSVTRWTHVGTFAARPTVRAQRRTRCRTVRACGTACPSPGPGGAGGDGLGRGQGLRGLPSPRAVGQLTCHQAVSRLRGMTHPYAERRARLVAALDRLPAERALDALLVTDLMNVRYLCGFSGSNGAVLITPDRGPSSPPTGATPSRPPARRQTSTWSPPAR